MKLDGLMLTKNKFSKIIEEIVWEEDLTYIDAVLHFCEQNNMNPEDIPKYLSDPIKNKIEAEARRLNYMQRMNQLSFEEFEE
jgi:hypothetical protein